jgi:hypothetical protein
MSRSSTLTIPAMRVPTFDPQVETTSLEQWDCGHAVTGNAPNIFRRAKAKKVYISSFSKDWAKDVPNLIARLSSMVIENKLQELNGIMVDFERRIRRIETTQTRVVPINTFEPEKYELLKPILVSVFPVDEEFEAGWYDANIHTSGENEEEAVNNLKSLILDYFDSLSKEPEEKLGIEPKRQLAIIKAFIQKTN